jgi:aldehyde dehydrogenase (NAD+)
LICFTGSTETGRLVAIEAAKNLTPCLLELGGKCPVIIDETANIENAVKRIIFGKFLNCGQTCVGVDHVFVH